MAKPEGSGAMKTALRNLGRTGTCAGISGARLKSDVRHEISRERMTREKVNHTAKSTGRNTLFAEESQEQEKRGSGVKKQGIAYGQRGARIHIQAQPHTC